jgi:PD-(D/E)XK nuclease superfamily protein
VETKQAIKQEFFPKCERIEPLILDSSAYLEAKQCFRLFFYKIVLGYRPKNSPTVLTWGSAYHKFREHVEIGYLEAKKKGLSNEYNVSEPFQKAYLEAMRYWDKEQGKDPNPDEYFGFMTRNRLHETLIYAYKYWIREKQLGRIEVLATEQLFNIEIVKGGVRRSGKKDQLIMRDNELWVRDFKTTTQDLEYYQRSLEPNDQFTGYTVAGGELSGAPIKGLVVEVMFNKKHHKTDRGKKETGPLIKEFTTTRTEEQLEQWKKEQNVLEKMIQLCREEDVWPMMDNARVNCKFCPYHRVCCLPNNDSAEYNLRNHYDFIPHDHTKFGESSES